jgi:hypothetical protein
VAGALNQFVANPMVSSKLSRVLLAMGATLGIAAVAALALDLRINIPDWMIQVAMIKLALIGAAGLLGAGAMLGRHAHRQASLRADQEPALNDGTPDLDQRVKKADAVLLRPESRDE